MSALVATPSPMTARPHLNRADAAPLATALTQRVADSLGICTAPDTMRTLRRTR